MRQTKFHLCAFGLAMKTWYLTKLLRTCVHPDALQGQKIWFPSPLQWQIGSVNLVYQVFGDGRLSGHGIPACAVICEFFGKTFGCC